MTSDSTVKTSWRDRLISIGFDATNPDEFNNKLRLTNVFIWLCVLYCVPYYIYFFSIGSFILGLIFVVNQLLFALSLVANHRYYYNAARILIIISTNYVVLLLNFAFGHESGFLLYYFAELRRFRLQRFYLTYIRRLSVCQRFWRSNRWCS